MDHVMMSIASFIIGARESSNVNNDLIYGGDMLDCMGLYIGLTNIKTRWISLMDLRTSLAGQELRASGR